MAPKKNANVSITAKPPDTTDSNTVTKKRPAASRVTKAKPLKTPSVVKIKIKKPRLKETEEQATIGETVKADKPIKYEKHLKPDHLIELANQVAQFQLGKSKLCPKQVTEAKVPEVAVSVPVPEAPVKKGRQKKTKKVEIVTMDSEVAPPAPKSKKKTPAKAKTPKGPPKPRIRKPKVTETKKAQPEYVKPNPQKSRAKPKSKKKLDPTSQDVLCPDILNELRSFEVSTTPKTSTRTNTSMSTTETSAPTDNFSWVKEISSSGTTTPTKDLVCINGKLPEIKLVDYRKSTRRQCKRMIDDVDSISGSSITSGSSTKRRKLPKNTFSMSQRKFRLSLRKKNNSWTVNNSQENNKQNGTRSPIITQNISTVVNYEKTSSSSSEISARANVDLSSSSTSTTSQSTRNTTNSAVNITNMTNVQNKTNIQNNRNKKIPKNLQDVRQKLDSLDLEFINWLGEVDKDLDLNKLSSISSDILRLEHEAINESQHFKLRLSNCSSERSSERNAIKTNSQVLIGEDVPDIDQSISNNTDNSNNNVDANSNTHESNENDVNIINRDNILAKPLPPIESTDNLRRKSCGETNYNNDDEDALSLYAESITGIESSKFSSLEAYKPARNLQCSPKKDDNEPKDPDFTEEYSYFKFSSGSEHSSPIIRKMPEAVTQQEIRNDLTKSSVPKFTERPKLVTCVKKIADSTSAQKDDHFTVSINANVPKVDDTLQNRNKPKSALMQANYNMTPPVKSQVFRGVCFFNLISKCRKYQCLFPHQRIPNEEIQNRVQGLQESNFICEYLLVRKYPQLRADYITIFVDECFRRDLTPILLEMALDCYREEVNIRTHALETALTNLSNKNLDDYLFFLHLKPEHLGQKVVDILMQAIAETQNFTRFKQVFVKLTEFMVHIRRKFVLDVAERILERICILPYEESLANAMFKIIQNTSTTILKHPSMRIFETRLRELNMNLFKKLVDLNMNILKKLEDNKKLRLEPTPPKVVNTCTKTAGDMNGRVPGLEKPREGENRRYTSPDTTHFDTNQTIIPPKINKPPNMNVSPMINQSSINKIEFHTLPPIRRIVDVSNSNAKTFIPQPSSTITSPVEAAHQRSPKPLAMPPVREKPLATPPFRGKPFRKPLLRPSYLKPAPSVNAEQSFTREHGNTKFSLLSQRFSGKDASFW